MAWPGGWPLAARSRFRKIENTTMSRLTRPLALALLLSGGGCATLQPAPPAERDAALRLDLGLAALHDGQHRAAFEELAWVMTHCPDREAGLYARYALVALELDPRNPDGRPEVGMQIISELILETSTPEWLLPLANTTYLLGLGLGAPAPDVEGPVEDPAEDLPEELPEELAVPEARTAAATRTNDRVRPVYGCGAPVDTAIRPAAALPVLPGPSLARMLTMAETERDTAAARARDLSVELETLRRELEATRAELDRIRRTLRP